MNATIRDLLDHQLWADVEHWRAIGSHVPARADKALHDRLHHIHQVQRFFVWIVGGGPRPTPTRPDDYPEFDDLTAYARESHDLIRGVQTMGADSRLDEQIVVPWFTDPPLRLSRAEALTQMAMHSHYHRGQNATRLREIGGEPPLTDLVVWYWKGRPAAVW